MAYLVQFPVPGISKLSCYKQAAGYKLSPQREGRQSSSYSSQQVCDAAVSETRHLRTVPQQFRGDTAQPH